MFDAIREGLVQRKSLLIRTHRKQKFPPQPPRCLLLCSSPNKKLSEHARVPHKNNSICSLFFQRQTRQSDRSVPKRSDGATTVRQSVCRLHLKHLSVASFPPLFFVSVFSLARRSSPELHAQTVSSEATGSEQGTHRGWRQRFGSLTSNKGA